MAVGLKAAAPKQTWIFAADMTSPLLRPISPEDSVILIRLDYLWRDTFRACLCFAVFICLFISRSVLKPGFLPRVALILMKQTIS